MDPANDNTKFRGGASSESNQPIRFAGSVLGAQRHVCAFFHNPDEEYRVLLPFIKDGFEFAVDLHGPCAPTGAFECDRECFPTRMLTPVVAAA